MATHSRGVAYGLIGAHLAGTAGSAVVLSGIAADPAVVGFARLIIGAIAMLALAPIIGGTFWESRKLIKQRTTWLMAIGAAVYQPCFFGSVQRINVAVGTLITVGSIPIFAGLVSWAHSRKRPSALWLFATVIALAGLALISLKGEIHVDRIGLAMGLSAGFVIGVYVNAARIALDAGAHPLLLPGLAYLIGSAFIFIFTRPDITTMLSSSRGIYLALYLGIVTMGLANFFQIQGQRLTSAPVAGTLLLADPLTATLLGVFVLGEVLTPKSALGMGLIVIGLLLQALAGREAKAPAYPA